MRSVDADHAASHLGKAAYFGIVLRGVPHLARQRKCLLPLDVLAQYGLSQEAVYSAQPSSQLQDVTFELAKHGRSHLLHAETIKADAARSSVALRLARARLTRLFERLEKAQFDPYRLKEDVLLPYHLWRNS